MFLVTAADS